MRTNYKKNIGTVSCATMRTQDLIPAFVDELRSMRPLHRSHRAELREIEARMAQDGYFDSEDADIDLNEFLFDVLNEYAMPYFYFGSHPGDGCDYGYWLSEEWEEQLEENGGMKVADLAEVPKGFTGDVAQVSDHGNLTMYRYSRGRARELWAIV